MSKEIEIAYDEGKRDMEESMKEEVKRLKKAIGKEKKHREKCIDICLRINQQQEDEIKELLAEKRETKDSDLSVVWDEFTNHLSTSHKTLLKLIDIHSNRIIELEKKFDEFKRQKK